MDDIVQKCLSLDQELRDARRLWLQPWQDVTRYTRAFGKDFVPYSSGVGAWNNQFQQGPQSPSRSVGMYNSTPVWALDRLTAGVLGVTAPRGEKWHTLGVDDPLQQTETDEEIIWFEQVRDHLFSLRYNPKANFARSIYMAVKSMCGLGTGLIMTEERLEGQLLYPFAYKFLSLAETAIGLNDWDEIDRVSRRFTRPAHVVAERWPDRASPRVRQMAANPKQQEEPVEILHCIYPRPAAMQNRLGALGAPFGSWYMETQTPTLLSEGGYYEFPVAAFYWYREPGSPYGESPVMASMADIKQLNSGSKSRIKAAAQWINPPLGTPSKGTGNRLNLNPGKNNPGAVDERGNLLVRPIITSPNPGFADAIIDGSEQTLKTNLYIDLFQALLDSPALTATQSTMIAKEKNELLSPLGVMIENSLAQIVERELGIMLRRGAFEPDSELAVPPSLDDRNVGVVYTSPLSRLRRAGEMLGIESTIQKAAELQIVSPDVVDNIDADATLRMVQEIQGAPKTMLVSVEQRDKNRQARNEALAEQQEMQKTQEAAQLVNDTAPALENLNALANTAA